MRYFRLFAAAVMAFVALESWAVDIIPTPLKYEKRNGVFTILTTTKITHYQGLRSSANYLAEHLPLQIREYNGASAGDIVLSTNKNLSEEEYLLDISQQGITIEGGSAAGLHNGIETLLQLLPSTVYSGDVALPAMLTACHIEDRPRFEYRGFMLDVCRTWMDKEKVKRFISNLAHHKINHLHLHLSDDEGWRVEIKSHPELAEVGGFRGVDSPVAARYGRWDEHYGGYYTHEDIREIVAYAAERNIEIIPEIDLPGHSHNLARVRPEVLCNYTPGMKASDGYDMRSVLCVAKEENYALLEDVIRELSELFSSPYIHIGGDEVSTSQWERCPDCQALMRREGMSEARELQDYFTRRVAAIVEKYGKHPGVWNEAARGNALPQGALVYGWESVKACQDATSKGYRTVVMPGEYFYFDMRQSRREEGHDWAAIFDAKKPLSFGFEKFTDEQMTHVAGVQASFFSEAYVSRLEYDYDFLYYQTYPRICALSEVAWCGRGAEWEEFYARLKDSHYSRMVAMGIDFRLFPPTVNYKDGVLTASTDDRSHIYYTILGEQGEQLYTQPIRTDHPERYAFLTRSGGAHSPEAGVAKRFSRLQPKVKITSSITESERFPYSNAEGYGRISRTSRTGRDGDWILYTFEQAVECRRLEVRTGNLQLPRYIFNAGYMEVSYDGKTFTRVGELKCGGAAIDNPKRAIKAVRVVCTESGNGADFVTVQEPMVFPIL